MEQRTGAEIHFVIRKGSTEDGCSEDMKIAFDTCINLNETGINCKWVKYDDCLQIINNQDLTKKDVFVLENFSGQLFEKLRPLRCLVVGPRCVTSCMMEGFNIPSGTEPIFTIAMRDMVITASGFSKTLKEDIKTKVLWMGGRYDDMLTEITTHLVSDTVLSDKYIKAAEKGIPIMGLPWVEAVWQESLKSNIRADSSVFDEHKLKMFHNLNITTTSIGKREKLAIVKCITENGGVFSGSFESEITNIVLLNRDGVTSDKYKAAQEFGKLCLLPEWVLESVKKGYALQVNKYKVYGATTSSPLSGRRAPDMSLNFSTIPGRPMAAFVDETANSDTSCVPPVRTKEFKKPAEENSEITEVLRMIENFETSKKAKPLFDGYCIYVHGIDGTCRDKLNALISRWGGLRYDRPDDRVTHALALPMKSHPVDLPAHVEILSPKWLLESITIGRVLGEEEYKIIQKHEAIQPATRIRSKQAEISSPMSKRSLQMLSQKERPPVPLFENANFDQDDEILQQYLTENNPTQLDEPTLNEDDTTLKDPVKSDAKPDRSAANPEVTNREQESTMTDNEEDEEEELEPIFEGLTFELRGFEQEAVIDLRAEIESEGGAVRRSGAEYVVVPLQFTRKKLRGAEKSQMITVFWLRDCRIQREILPVQYYHQPVEVPNTTILDGVVLSISTYSGQERSFLDELAKLLGAVSELRFCRKTTATALASTHLVCPLPTGDKYAGAVKWGVPAVTGQWLLQCANRGMRLPEEQFLVTNEQAQQPEEEPSPDAMDNITLRSRCRPVEKDNNEESLKENIDAVMPQDDAMPPPTERATRRSLAGGDDTPQRNAAAASLTSNGDEMSPASRYIAMARQGLLGCSQETPKRVAEVKRDTNPAEIVKTPDIKLTTPDMKAFSPTTRRRLQALRKGDMPSGPIATPNFPRYKNVKTPDSSFGRALAAPGEKLSPNSRKQLWTDIDELPGHNLSRLDVRKETPLSDFCDKMMSKLHQRIVDQNQPKKLHFDDGHVETPPNKIAKISTEKENIDTPSNKITNISERKTSERTPAKVITPDVEKQLNQLSSLLENRFTPRQSIGSKSALVEGDLNVHQQGSEGTNKAESQSTVGWDDSTQLRNIVSNIVEEPSVAVHRKFMLSSNVQNREELIQMIVHLGGTVSESSELDLEATHLLCSTLGRSEKLLGSIAAGKWILHPSYVVRCNQAGTFLHENDFEWGNESGVCASLDRDASLAKAARSRRQNREANKPSAYCTLRAVLHVLPNKRGLFSRLIKAGGGTVIDDSPPYSNKTATHCFVEMKRYPLEQTDLEFFAKNRIPVCPALMLHNYLVEEDPPSALEHAVPEYKALVRT